MLILCLLFQFRWSIQPLNRPVSTPHFTLNPVSNYAGTKMPEFTQLIILYDIIPVGMQHSLSYTPIPV